MQRSRGWTIGRVVGVPVVIEPGWAVMAVVLVALALPWAGRVVGTGPAALGWAVAGVLALLASVFAHELAHALMARRAGLHVSRISLTFLGGHTTHSAGLTRPGTEALVAVVGPLTNLAIAALAWAGSQAVTGPGYVLLWVVALVNVFVGVFNLLPGLPLDGGWVLEAGVWALTGRRETGTVVAARVGQAAAAGVVAWVVLPDLLAGRSPSYTMIIWGVVIAASLWQGATAALRRVAEGRRVAGLALSALATPAVAVAASAAVRDLTRVPAGTTAVLVRPDGVPVALVDPAAVAAVPPAAWDTTPVAAVAHAIPPEAVVAADLTGIDAVAAARQAARSPALVLVRDAAVVGVVRVVDVVAALRA